MPLLRYMLIAFETCFLLIILVDCTVGLIVHVRNDAPSQSIWKHLVAYSFHLWILIVALLCTVNLWPWSR
jgi:hypothetical protein